VSRFGNIASPAVAGPAAHSNLGAVRAPSFGSEAHRQSLGVAASAHGFDGICAVTSDETKAPLFRLPVEPNDRNGLIATSRLMVDKITIVPIRTSRALSEENSTLVQWLTVNCSADNLWTNAAMLSLVALGRMSGMRKLVSK
jgi:hypothetical protein